MKGVNLGSGMVVGTEKAVKGNGHAKKDNGTCLEWMQEAAGGHQQQNKAGNHTGTNAQQLVDGCRFDDEVDSQRTNQPPQQIVRGVAALRQPPE